MISFYLAVWQNFETQYINSSKKISIQKEDIKKWSRERLKAQIVYPFLWEITMDNGDVYLSVDESLERKLPESGTGGE